MMNLTKNKLQPFTGWLVSENKKKHVPDSEPSLANGGAFLSACGCRFFFCEGYDYGK